MSAQPAGLGRKHPQLDIPVANLFLDSENPRLPEEAQGKKEAEILDVLYREFSLDELADSMAQNGYFDEEPLVAIPQNLPKSLTKAAVGSNEFLAFISNKETLFTVVEGNRRLATIKLLLDNELRKKFHIQHWPILSEAVRGDLSVLPVIVYLRRSDVVPYLGVRHIVGIQKWDSYAKARYIAKMIENGISISDIESQIGDKTGTLIKNFICFKLLNQASNEFAFDLAGAKDDFSLLLLAIGQGDIKRFLGMPIKLRDTDPNMPVPTEKVGNMKDLILWIFGNGKTRPVIRESRDITNYLSHIVASADAIEYLKKSNDILGAYDRTDGEEKMVLKYLNAATLKLESVLSVVHRHKTPEVLAQVKTCEEAVKAIRNTVEG